MARTENRTEFHRKLAEQIQAIESVAKETKGVATETKGVATAITDEDRVADILPDLVILVAILVQALLRACSGVEGGPIFVSEITLDRLRSEDFIDESQKGALSGIGFSDNTKLQELYRVICPNAPDTSPA